MTRILKNYINGQWVDSQATNFEEVMNPATEEPLVRVPFSTPEETHEAIEIAQTAFESWSKVPVPKRGRLLFKLQNLLVEHTDELARLITIENGKALSEAKGEVGRGIENVENAASIMNLMMGDSISTAATDVEITNYRYPIGVVGAITPFNFPMMVPFWIFPMALACGNAVVMKPSEKTPLLMEKIVELVEEAGFPKGIFNVVYGAHDVVNTLLSDELVRGISFVGSKPVGEYVYKTGTSHLKRVQALTGAKNHVVVLKDANIDRAVKDIIGGAYGSAGERCMAASVVVLEEAIADEFLSKFKQAAEAIKIGNGLDEGVFLGPVIRKEARDRTFDYIQSGVDQGAELVLDGRKNLPDKGYYVGPTIFDQVTTEMKIWQDEIFAPVASIT